MTLQNWPKISSGTRFILLHMDWTYKPGVYNLRYEFWDICCETMYETIGIFLVYFQKSIKQWSLHL